MKIETLQLAGLTTRIVGSGPVTAVLCHGFGAPGDDLVALTQFINAPNTRFVFPAAPIELGGLYVLFTYIKQRRDQIPEKPLTADERRRAEELLASLPGKETT